MEKDKLDMIDSEGNRLIVIATLPDGVKIAIDTKEKLEAFFAQHPSAKLDFIVEEKE
jgi:hypothetical protein